MQIKYRKRGGYGDLDVRTELDEGQAFVAIDRPWHWKYDRRGLDWKDLWATPYRLAASLPTDCGVEILLDPPPPLRPIDFVWSGNPDDTKGTYGFSAYSTGGDKENDADIVFHGYDNFFMKRKPWKVKSQRHAIHLLASMGVCRAKV